MEKQELVLQMHYFMEKEGCHYINAITHNECERILLSYIKEIAQLSAEKDLELISHLSEEGGWKDNLTIICKQPLFVGLAGLLLGHFISPARDSTEKVKELIECVEMIKKAKLTEDEVAPLIKGEEKLEKFASAYYGKLNIDPQVVKVQSMLADVGHNKQILNTEIEKKDFEGHIATKRTRKYNVVGTTILIISPLLVEIKRLKWRGKYEGKEIPFTMEDNDFLTDVHNRKVSFESGTSINCDLQIEETVKIRAGYETVESRYIVTKVNNWFDGAHAKVGGKEYAALK
uniref:Uncharacterized protein n=3 Tax=unclassified Prevotella TaxID=2638335 RepID=A0AB33JQ46_9BACT